MYGTFVIQRTWNRRVDCDAYRNQSELIISTCYIEPPIWRRRDETRARQDNQLSVNSCRTVEARSATVQSVQMRCFVKDARAGRRAPISANGGLHTPLSSLFFSIPNFSLHRIRCLYPPLCNLSISGPLYRQLSCISFEGSPGMQTPIVVYSGYCTRMPFTVKPNKYKRGRVGYTGVEREGGSGEGVRIEIKST